MISFQVIRCVFVCNVFNFNTAGLYVEKMKCVFVCKDGWAWRGKEEENSR